MSATLLPLVPPRRPVLPLAVAALLALPILAVAAAAITPAGAVWGHIARTFLPEMLGNTALLGALCATGALPFGVEALKGGIRKYLPSKLVETNLRAVDLGAAAVQK